MRVSTQAGDPDREQTVGVAAAEDGSTVRVLAEAARDALQRARSEEQNGSLERAAVARREAAARARELGDAELLAAAATALVEPSIWAHPGEEHSLCLESLSMLGPDPVPGEPPERAEWRTAVRTRLDGLSTGWHVRPRAVAAIDEDEARRRFSALRTRYRQNVGADGLGVRLVLAEDCIDLGHASGLDWILAWGWHWRLDDLLHLGLRVEVNQAVTELTAIIGRLRSPLWDWRLLLIQACMALLEDRIADARALRERAAEAAERAGTGDGPSADLVLRYHLAARTGEGIEEIEREVREWIAGAPYFAHAWWAKVLLEAGRTDEAVSVWRSLRGHLADQPRDVGEWLLAPVGLVEVMVAAQDAEGARTLRDSLLPAAHLHVAGPATTPYGGPVALALARLEAFLGDAAESRDHAQDALVRAESMGAPWYAAAARTLLAPSAAALAPLSPRETEIARFIADARTNREIATTLFLSERTVEQHVRSILHKLGAPNRAAIVGWVLRAGR